jgi:hypothetical protein
MWGRISPILHLVLQGAHDRLLVRSREKAVCAMQPNDFIIKRADD